MTEPMRVYLAARFSRKAEMQAVAERLNALGTYVVTSRWIDGSHRKTDSEELAQFAAEDLQDIDGSDGLIAYMESPESGYQSGGRHVEFGYAIARDMWIAVIGEPENVFHLLSDGQVERFDSLDAMLEAYQ